MKSRQPLCIAGIVVGAVLMTAPWLGVLGTMFGMMHSFRGLASPGISDPETLSAGVAHSLLSTAIGLALFPVGLFVLVLSIVFLVKAQRKQPPPLPDEGR